MHEFLIKSNDYLKRDVKAFYHTDYVNMRETPLCFNLLKNTFGNESPIKLKDACQNLTDILITDLPIILNKLCLSSITICVVPRAKTNYQTNQLLFKSTISNVINQLTGFLNGTDFIRRHINTRTTHFRNDVQNYVNDGPAPYPGITRDTCEISDEVRGKNILLIDDLYTKMVDIDEDAIQALLDKGANSVFFYSIGRTLK